MLPNSSLRIWAVEAKRQKLLASSGWAGYIGRVNGNLNLLLSSALLLRRAAVGL
jgi:hypothetical protein